MLSLLLVLSMGVDYGIFLVECGNARNLGPTTMSLWGAAVTTMLSFGLLALSKHAGAARDRIHHRHRHGAELPARAAVAGDHARGMESN